jgi:hypothetical protein
MPAATPRRAGFPTARLALLCAALSVGSAPPAQAVLLPPPIRLPILFDREAWAPVLTVERPVPLRAGVPPVAFEEHHHG